MCFFVTIAVPSQHAEQIGEVFARGFQTRPTANAGVTAVLPAGYAARLITSGMCSCDLYARPRDAGVPDPAAHLRRKYEKRGWSEAKIKRALEQVEVQPSKTNRATSGFRPDVLSAFEALCRAAGSVALLVHWYSGDIESERLPLGEPRRCKCDELAARAQSLVEDQILIAAAPLAR
jgi:hypothetical protein